MTLLHFFPRLTSSFHKRDHLGSERWRHFQRSHSKSAVDLGLKLLVPAPSAVLLLPPLTPSLGASFE